MRLSAFEKFLMDKIQKQVPLPAPGVQVQVHQQGRKICDISVGDTFPYYDLASLTKIIFTVQAMMKAFEEEKWNLKTKVNQVLRWFPHENILIKDLLTHTSGYTWWYPFYEKLDLNSSSLHRWTEASRMIRELPLENQGKCVYSDVGFILLGHVLEGLYDRPLIFLWDQLKENFYSRSTLHFHPENKPVYSAKYYAPTQRCTWRGRTMQGEVDDRNCWAFGGVSSHAGLFGSIDDISWFGLLLRSQIKGISKTLIRQKTAKLFTARAIPESVGDWALGYMMPTPGKSSSGKHFSHLSIGHTGFTGTSFWYDPVSDLSVSILSNRIFLGVENNEFAKMRPQIHNWIAEGLRRV